MGLGASATTPTLRVAPNWRSERQPQSTLTCLIPLAMVDPDRSLGFKGGTHGARARVLYRSGHAIICNGMSQGSCLCPWFLLKGLGPIFDGLQSLKSATILHGSGEREEEEERGGGGGSLLDLTAATLQAEFGAVPDSEWAGCKSTELLVKIGEASKRLQADPELNKPRLAEAETEMKLIVTLMLPDPAYLLLVGIYRAGHIGLKPQGA